MSFADVTSDATPIHSSIVAGSYELYKAGNLRYVRIGVDGITMSNGWNDLVRVASAHRPQLLMFAYGMYPMGTLRDVQVTTDGYVRIWVNAGTSQNLRVYITYMV